MGAFDYSKWDNIEISDDETDLHPNIDAKSWFDLKHRLRVERETKEEIDTKRINESMPVLEARLKVAKERLENAVSEEVIKAAKATIDDLESKIKQDQDRLVEITKTKKWNWENMCDVKEDYTEIAQVKQVDDVPKPADSSRSYENWSKDNGEKLKQFAIKYEELFLNRRLEILAEHCREYSSLLVDDNASSMCLLECLNEEMDNNRPMCVTWARVARLLLNLDELSKLMKLPKIQAFPRLLKGVTAESQFNEVVKDVEQFVEKVAQRAVIKKKELEEAIDADMEEVPVGPGGLHPNDVLPQMPVEMQKAFVERDTQALERLSVSMDLEEFFIVMDKAVKSGLWNSEEGLDYFEKKLEALRALKVEQSCETKEL